MLIGTSRYDSRELPGLPAVRNNVRELASLLSELSGFPRERCIVLPEPTDPRTVYRTLRHYALDTDDTFFVYFSGHGQTGRLNDLHLCMTATNPDELRVSALPYDLVREIMLDSPAANRIVILDCCFSGRAIDDMSGNAVGGLGIEGTYVLTSAAANAVALAPQGEKFTAFTGELIQLLRTGVPGETDLLTFASLYRHLLDRMTSRGLPRPHQRGTGTADQLALARNRAFHELPEQPVSVLRSQPIPVREPRQHPAPARESRPRHAPVRAPSAGTNSALGWLSLAGALGYGLLQLIMIVSGLIEGTADFTSWALVVDGEYVFWGDLLSLVIAVILGVAVWWRARAGTAGPQTIGLAAAFGLSWIPLIPSFFRYKWTISPILDETFSSLRWINFCVLAGFLAMITAAILAVVAAVRIRESIRPGHAAYAGRVILLGVCTAVPLIVVTVLQFDSWTAIVYAIGTTLLAIALPVAATASRPLGLASGLLGGWLLTAACWGVGFISSVFSVIDPATVSGAVFSLATLALFAVYCRMRQADASNDRSFATRTPRPSSSGMAG